MSTHLVSRLAVLVALAFFSCLELDQQTKDLEMVKEVSKRNREDIAELQRTNEQNGEEIKWLVNQTPACQHRKAGQDLADSCRDGHCDPGMFTRAMDGLKDMRDIYQVAYLIPAQGADSLNAQRLVDIENSLFKQPNRPVTRVLVLALPRKEGMAGAQQAKDAAAGVLKQIHEKLPQTRVIRSLEPSFIGCTKENRDRVLQFAQRKPPIPGAEPQTKDAMVVLVFRLDCWN